MIDKKDFYLITTTKDVHWLYQRGWWEWLWFIPILVVAGTAFFLMVIITLHITF